MLQQLLNEDMVEASIWMANNPSDVKETEVDIVKFKVSKNAEFARAKDTF
jgi:hypothetical protein